MFVHGPAVRQAALDLIGQGYNDCEVAGGSGVPRRTVRDWRVPHLRAARDDLACLRCWRPTSPVVFTPPEYAELLGLYLGDGHITPMARTQRLRLMLDAKYPVIVEEAADLIVGWFVDNKVGRQYPHDGADGHAALLPPHWACLFPQHGPGKKHDRRSGWSLGRRRSSRAAPLALLRGFIRSDGCVFINRTGKYDYESYDFFNLSSDLLALFSRRVHRSASNAAGTKSVSGSTGGPASHSCSSTSAGSTEAALHARLRRSLRLW